MKSLQQRANAAYREWKKERQAARKKGVPQKHLNVYHARNAELRRMGFKNYDAYLKSPLWKSIRRQVFDRSPKCELCGEAWACVVHHQDYNPRTLQGRRTNSLIAACNDCHYQVEFDSDGNKKRPGNVFSGARAARYAIRKDEARRAQDLREIDRDLEERLAASCT